MVRLGASILRGEWLGEYTGHLMLSKPAGYPLFLAWTHFLPWAPTMTVHIILLVGVLLVARELRCMNMSRPFVLLFIALSALQPQWYGAEMSRVYRDGLLTALTFLGLGLSLRLGRTITGWLSQKQFRGRHVVEVVIVAFLTGATLSWSIATKPGWYPLAFVMIGFSLQQAYPIHRSNWRRWTPKIAVAGIATLIGLTSIVGYVRVQNQDHYGISQLDSYSAGSFPTALNKWTSVKSDKKQKYVFVDASQRQRVYAISPTAKKLEPYLEVAPKAGWKGQACSSVLKICDESAAWFVWDLRDAMHSAGLDTTAMLFETSLAQISHDISVACNSHTIQCSNDGLAPGVVSLADMSKREVLDAYATAINWMVFPDIGNSNRGGVVPKGIMTRDWDQVVKGLPTRGTLNNYRPEVTAIGNTISLLQHLYAVVWPILILMAVVGFMTSVFGKARFRELQLVSLLSILGLILFIGQLALLEVSSGLYLSAGKPLYLLPAFPFLILCTVIELSVTSTSIQKRPLLCP
jgi:hypothetical protein